jgi:hypothetical protein
VYISQLIRYAGACFAYKVNYLQKNWCCRVIMNLV